MLKVKRILVPIDFSDASLAAVDWATELAQTVGASIDLLHVWESRSYASNEVFVELPSQHDEALAEFSQSKDGRHMAELLDGLRRRGIPGVLGRLESGNCAEQIVRLAEKDHYDLIVMGAHGRGMRQLFGNVAEGVSRRAACPVVTVHGRRSAPAVAA